MHSSAINRKYTHEQTITVYTFLMTETLYTYLGVFQQKKWDLH